LVYDVARVRVAGLVQAILGFPTIKVVDEALSFCARSRPTSSTGSIWPSRTLAAWAEVSDQAVASFDRGIDRITSIRRLVPGT
jgi:hypothetical protein